MRQGQRDISQKPNKQGVGLNLVKTLQDIVRTNNIVKAYKYMESQGITIEGLRRHGRALW